MVSGVMILAIIGVIFGGIFSWIVSHRYYKRSMEDFVRNEKLKDYNMDNFIRHLKDSKWYNRRIKNKDTWICKSDVRYQIYLDSDKSREFVEDWTEKFIKPIGRLYPACLMIDNNVFEEISFIYVDEYRYLVPIPEIQFDDKHKKRSFFWDKSKLYYLVHEIIGSKDSMNYIINTSGVTVK